MKSRSIVIEKCIKCSHEMRRNALTMAHMAGSNGAHLGAGLSIIEIMSTLYNGVMFYDLQNPFSPDRDRFILSKGHGALGYYTALSSAGIISEEQLFTFEKNGGDFPGQPRKNLDLGIEFSGGSLGLGLSYGVGMALAGKKRAMKYNVFVLVGDGEINEGSVWEAAMSAVHFELQNLTVIVDANGMQSDGKTTEIMSNRLPEIWSGFGFNTVLVQDGHSIEELYDAFTSIFDNGMPKVIIANTVKGKGISFMENNNEWHHGVLNKEKYDLAMSEVTNR